MAAFKESSKSDQSGIGAPYDLILTRETLGPVFIVRSYIQDRLKYSLKKSQTNQKAALTS